MRRRNRCPYCDGWSANMIVHKENCVMKEEAKGRLGKDLESHTSEDASAPSCVARGTAHDEQSSSG